MIIIADANVQSSKWGPSSCVVYILMNFLWKLKCFVFALDFELLGHFYKKKMGKIQQMSMVGESLRL